MNIQPFEKQMPDIVRSEYGLWPPSAEAFRRDDSAPGIPVSNSGRQPRTAALEKQSFAYNPDNRR